MLQYSNLIRIIILFEHEENTECIEIIKKNYRRYSTRFNNWYVSSLRYLVYYA